MHICCKWLQLIYNYCPFFVHILMRNYELALAIKEKSACLFRFAEYLYVSKCSPWVIWEEYRLCSKGAEYIMVDQYFVTVTQPVKLLFERQQPTLSPKNNSLRKAWLNFILPCIINVTDTLFIIIIPIILLSEPWNLLSNVPSKQWIYSSRAKTSLFGCYPFSVFSKKKKFKSCQFLLLLLGNLDLTVP